MPDQTEAERQSAERVAKAARINDEVFARLAQPLTPPGVVDATATAPKPAPKTKRKAADE